MALTYLCIKMWNLEGVECLFVNHILEYETEGLFTWSEGATANQVTRLEWMKHSPPLHAEFTALLPKLRHRH